jgi:acyl-CoA thioester hydrolase
MGVVHHSNYIRYMEEARFAWLRQENLIHLHGVDQNCVFAVLDIQIAFKSPLKWGDSFEVELNVVQIRSRFRFDAVIMATREGRPVVSQGVVVLACVNNKMQPIKPPGELQTFFKREAKHGS